MKRSHVWILGVLIVIAIIVAALFITKTSAKQGNPNPEVLSATELSLSKEPFEPEAIPSAPIVHLQPPAVIKALYLSSWGASSGPLRHGVMNLARTSEVNAVIIDIKDDTGRVALPVASDIVTRTGSLQNRIPDLTELLKTMGDEGIYRIGRVMVFQDPYLAKVKPEWALRRTDTGEPWTDRNGQAYLNPQNPEVRAYMIALAIDGYKAGYDEINFDYIRYPSDGNLKILDYGLSEGQVRADIMEDFFKELHAAMSAHGIKTSADLFGMTTTNRDDLGIGQVFERALPYFDAIAPMVYPSHYPKTYLGYANPASYPYEVVHHAMKAAVDRAVAAGYSKDRVRAWIQDFNLGAVYTAEMVKEQLNASADLGIGWMVWDPANTYTVAAYGPKTSPLTTAN
jgi:hypothetical protein